MADVGTVVTAVISGGVGASLGTVGAALIGVLGHRGQSRAEAANLLTDAAAKLADKQALAIERLEHDNKGMRTAIIILTEVIDELLPELDLSPELLLKLRRANNAAKAAT